MVTEFFISDTHFGDAEICTYQPLHRLFSSMQEHDEELIRRWNSVVGKQDIVWHLGDFALGDISIAERLHGDKRLVMGNHDRQPPVEYARYFSQIGGAIRYEDFLLTHMPVHPLQLYQCKVNLHGHMHKGAVEDARYFNVSCERLNLTPVSLDDLLQKIAASPFPRG